MKHKRVHQSAILLCFPAELRNKLEVNETYHQMFANKNITRARAVQ